MTWEAIPDPKSIRKFMTPNAGAVGRKGQQQGLCSAALTVSGDANVAGPQTVL